MKARADAVSELEAAGTFEDLTTLTPGEDDIDRQLRQLSTSSEVDDDLAKMKAELGMASAPAGELGAGGAAEAGQSSSASETATPSPAQTPAEGQQQ
jgi:phage shock protein A